MQLQLLLSDMSHLSKIELLRKLGTIIVFFFSLFEVFELCVTHIVSICLLFLLQVKPFSSSHMFDAVVLSPYYSGISLYI